MRKLKVDSWVAVRNGCQMRCRVRDTDDVMFVVEDGGEDFEFVFDGDALRQFAHLCSGAIRELDALATTETNQSDEDALARE